jgi:hypothetical protein
MSFFLIRLEYLNRAVLFGTYFIVLLCLKRHGLASIGLILRSNEPRHRAQVVNEISLDELFETI